MKMHNTNIMNKIPFIYHLGSADRNKSPTDLTDNTDRFTLNAYGMNNTDCRLIGEYLTDAVLNTDVFLNTNITNNTNVVSNMDVLSEHK